MSGELWCATGTLCQIPDTHKGLALHDNQTLWVSSIEASEPHDKIQVFQSMTVREHPSRKDAGSVWVDRTVHVGKKLCLGDLCINREDLQKLVRPSKG